MELANGSSVMLSALGGLGASLICFAFLGARQRAATARRVSAFIGEAPTADAGGVSRSPSQGLMGRLVRVARAHPASVRGALIVAALVAAVPAIAGGSAPAAAAVFGVGVLLVLASRQEHYRDQIERQVSSAVALLASGLRAGYSVPQAIALVARESPEPTATLFRRTITQIELGGGLVDALERLARDTASADYELLSIIVAVQHETGGNLAQALDAVADTLRERFELREQVQALTAQQRLSSLILTLLPVGVFVFLVVINRPFVDPLLSTLGGRALLGLVVLLLAVGWVAMRAIARVDE